MLKAIFVLVLILGFVSAFYVSNLLVLVMAIPLIVLAIRGVKRLT